MAARLQRRYCPHRRNVPEGSNSGQSLFTRVVNASGLSSIIAPGMVRRALNDVGSNPRTARASTYLRALPAIEARLKAFFPPHEIAETSHRIKAILAEFDEG